MRRYQVIYIRLQGKPGSVDRKFEGENGILEQTDQQVNTGIIHPAGNRHEVCAASGISYSEYAKGAGGGAFFCDFGRKAECAVLQGMFYADR